MRALTLLFVLLFVSSAWAQSQEKAVPPITSKTKGADKSEHNTETKPSESKNLPPSIDVKIGGKLEIYSDERNGEANTESTKWTDPLSIFTGLLVFVTGVLAVFTYKLWSSTADASTRQAGEMKNSLDIARQSADAATTSAQASKDMAGLMEENAEHELRAYMGVAKVTIMPESEPLSGELVITNFGKTMAKDVEIRIAGAIMSVVIEFPIGDRQCKTVTMPGEPMRFDERIDFKGGDLRTLDDGLGNIYLWGRIDYKDVFQKPHRTMFRFMSYKHKTILGPGGSFRARTWDVKTCEEGNDAD